MPWTKKMHRHYQFALCQPSTKTGQKTNLEIASEHMRLWRVLNW